MTISSFLKQAKASYLRAAFSKFRLGVCKIKKSKIPKLCQNLGLDELHEKNSLSPIRFLFYANGGKIGLAALPSAWRGPDNPLFERRLKINKTENVTIDYLNEKTRIYEHTEVLIVLFSFQMNRWAIFVCFFFINISLISTDKQMVKLRG